MSGDDVLPGGGCVAAGGCAGSGVWVGGETKGNVGVGTRCAGRDGNGDGVGLALAGTIVGEALGMRVAVGSGGRPINSCGCIATGWSWAYFGGAAGSGRR